MAVLRVPPHRRGSLPPATGHRHVDGDGVEPQAPLEAARQGGQQVVAGVGPDVVDDALHDGQRVVPRAEHEPIDEVADPLPRRLDRQGDGTRRGHEQPRRPAAADQPAEPGDDDRVDRRRSRRRAAPTPGSGGESCSASGWCAAELVDERPDDQQRHGRDQHARPTRRHGRRATSRRHRGPRGRPPATQRPHRRTATRPGDRSPPGVDATSDSRARRSTPGRRQPTIHEAATSIRRQPAAFAATTAAVAATATSQIATRRADPIAMPPEPARPGPARRARRPRAAAPTCRRRPEPASGAGRRPTARSPRYWTATATISELAPTTSSRPPRRRRPGRSPAPRRRASTPDPSRTRRPATSSGPRARGGRSRRAAR